MAFIDDFFCPEDNGFIIHNNCVQGIAKALQTNDDTYSILAGKSLQCSFFDCNVKVSFTGKVFFQTLEEVEGPTTTMMDEVKAYLTALRAGGPIAQDLDAQDAKTFQARPVSSTTAVDRYGVPYTIPKRTTKRAEDPRPRDHRGNPLHCGCRSASPGIADCRRRR